MLPSGLTSRLARRLASFLGSMGGSGRGRTGSTKRTVLSASTTRSNGATLIRSTPSAASGLAAGAFWAAVGRHDRHAAASNRTADSENEIAVDRRGRKVGVMADLRR